MYGRSNTVEEQKQAVPLQIFHRGGQKKKNCSQNGVILTIHRGNTFFCLERKGWGAEQNIYTVYTTSIYVRWKITVLQGSH